MSITEMYRLFAYARHQVSFVPRGVAALLFTLLLGMMPGASDAAAQRTIKREYPANANVRLQLENMSGTIRVEVWERAEIEVRADMEYKTMKLVPEAIGNTLVINVIRDNGMRADMGNVDFHIRVPVNSGVDLKTKRGNIYVRGVQGNLVRADVTLDGDIELLDIGALNVIASNRGGQIIFDGTVVSGGSYDFKSAEGPIYIHVPQNSGFNLTAVAPMTGDIQLGSFASFFGGASNRRRVTGSVNNGNASFVVHNQRGSILFR